MQIVCTDKLYYAECTLYNDNCFRGDIAKSADSQPSKSALPTLLTPY